MNLKPSEPITAGYDRKNQTVGNSSAVSDARIIMVLDESRAIRFEGKARGGRTRGFERQPYRSTGRRHRASEPDLVRACTKAGRH